MTLQLNKPLCFFDLETTGIDITKDRIVEMSVLKLLPNHSRETKVWLVNPEMPIPKQASDIHGITDDKVSNAPTFRQLAPQVYQFIKGADLAGYNSNRFDVPLLAEEFLRAEVNFDFKNIMMIDVQTIFHKKEKRTLEAAYKFYCDKFLENAHSSQADAHATFEVLQGQLDMYTDLQPDVKFLSEFSTQKNHADLAGFISLNDKNEEVFSFGKYKGQTVESVIEKDSGYFSWIQNADFPRYTKKILAAIRLRKLNSK